MTLASNTPLSNLHNGLFLGTEDPFASYMTQLNFCTSQAPRARNGAKPLARPSGDRARAGARLQRRVCHPAVVLSPFFCVLFQVSQLRRQN